MQKNDDNNSVDSEGINVTDFPTETTSFSEIEKLPQGEILKLRINRTGSEIIEYEVVLEGTLSEQGENLIVCRTKNGLKIGAGDSGSPLLTKDGKIAGALCYGFSGNNSQFMARAIDDVTSITEGSKSAHNTELSFASRIAPFYFARGFTNELSQVYSRSQHEQYRKKLSKFSALNDYNYGSKSTHIINSNIVPGSSISVNVITGDIYSIGAVGTISYIKDNIIYGFGHPFMDEEPLALPVYKSEMITLIESHSHSASFKLTSQTNEYLGALIKDKTEGIAINKNLESKDFPLKTVVNISERSINKTIEHRISNQQDIGYENYLTALINSYSLRSVFGPGTYDYVNAEINVSFTFSNNESIKYTEFRECSHYLDYDLFATVLDTLDTHGGNRDYNIGSAEIRINVSGINSETCSDNTN